METSLKHTLTKHIITIDKSGTVGEALELMRTYSIRHLPVMGEAKGKIVGMLSDRDLLRSASKGTAVQELMSYPVKSFDVNTPCLQVVQAMVESKMSSFLVTDKEQIVGIVTSEDMLLLLADFLQEDVSAKHIVGEYLSIYSGR